ncbi:hypothetical protein Gpo141_00014143, partial [Globisporangium polare]
MKLLASTAAAALLMASAAASDQAPPVSQSLHESVWTSEFPLPLAATTTASKFTTIPLFGDLSSTEPFNLYGLVTIGTPPQHFKVHIATHQSVLSIPNFKPPPSSHQVFYNHITSSSYEADGAGIIAWGPLYTYDGYFSRDTIRFGDFGVSNVSFAEVTEVLKPRNFADLQIDGFFGLGPAFFFDTVLQRLLRAKAISEPVFTFHFNKSQEPGGDLLLGSDEPTSVGEVTIGAIDKRHYSGHIHYVNTVSDSVWAVKLDAVTVHGKSVVSNSEVLIAKVMPSYPFILGPNADIEKLAKAVGATEGDTIDCSSQGPDIVIKIGGVKYTLTKAEYTRRIDEKTCRWVFTGQEFG